MKHRTTQILFSYWNETRQDRPAPHRFDVEPSRLSHILPEAMILEHRSDGEYYFRLAGTRICEQFGIEFRGTRFIDFWNWSDRHQIIHHLDPIRELSKITLLTFEAISETTDVATFEMLLLPLTLDGKTNDRFLGSLACTSQATWLGHDRIMDVHLLTVQTHEPQHLEQTHFQTEIREQLSPHQELFSLSTSGTNQRRRRFRVIEGGLNSRHPDDRT